MRSTFAVQGASALVGGDDSYDPSLPLRINSMDRFMHLSFSIAWSHPPGTTTLGWSHCIPVGRWAAGGGGGAGGVRSFIDRHLPQTADSFFEGKGSGFTRDVEAYVPRRLDDIHWHGREKVVVRRPPRTCSAVASKGHQKRRKHERTVRKRKSFMNCIEAKKYNIGGRMEGFN